jgi:hypothetical protein
LFSHRDDVAVDGGEMFEVVVGISLAFCGEKTRGCCGLPIGDLRGTLIMTNGSRFREEELLGSYLSDCFRKYETPASIKVPL